MKANHDIHQRVDLAAEGFRLSYENLLQRGFNVFRMHPGTYILYTLIALLVLSNPLTGLVLGGPVVVGFYQATRRTTPFAPPAMEDFFAGFEKLLPLLILQLFAFAIILLGCLLLLLPGIFLAVSYVFAHFFVWFYDIPPLEALRLSRRTVSGNFGQVLGLLFLIAGLNLLGLMAFGIGILATIPLSFGILFASFDDIIGIP